ncbi:AzlC family ABC transporter permease [Agrobacterium larrymoorei]|uniref:AzlC family ABC transporter permease n=1 Tax=Agrobacterium larrymoorei TaxID=160699 RepID=A0A4D7DJY4_9HYPH|nr:AzlC family ABC transporter permease [Agrobacterium larrymoorei]QCI97903.1 AzlC family ABC transporter permease [Agrobacterium larrymoorei]QYA06649.1 AzlC family ABC transporter permease [Agrobacterium larrymoorei]
MSAYGDTDSLLLWFARGMRGIFSLPALILMTSFVGFSAFALESGVTRGEAVFMTLTIWALPAKMILIGSMVSGAGLAACFLAVTLSSIRMMPMVASIIPEMRTARTPTWLLLFLSHFVAITAWVYATQNLSKVPREARLAWFAGFGMTLTLVNAAIVAICYGVVAAFPPLVAGVLFFLTPVYFISSIWASARHSVVKVAFVIGVIGGPLFAVIEPEFDILYAGIGGGTLAYLIDRFWLRRRIEPTSVEGEP